MAPVINGPDDCLNAETHMVALASFLPFFDKNPSNVKFLVGDYFRSFLSPYEDDLDQVQLLMKHLRTIKQAAKLRLKTLLKPKLRQEMRWWSTYSMLARYFELCEFHSADDEDLADVLPTPAVHRKLKALKEQLSDVESVSKTLQCDALNLLDARDLLDGLLEIQPSFSNYLEPNADIVHSPDFESGVVKVLSGQPAKMGFADRILKKRKTESTSCAYELLDVIPPTSNIVERLFSSTRMVLRYERNRLSPFTLEMILFLRVNETYWDVTTVDACI
ncbi:hypothetical protein PC110_g1343 [Phytophthora cactorum]|uniref:HAT C-terminal dimerisation domain-containing protein n=1 Tax=Phytophthora cactorum TaxID=29920 RepID=A0A329T135_9STRA|nr:hypothetical protein PC110_g1343 [Phytophthora cactorum]